MAGELVDHPAGNGQMYKFSTFEFDFLAILFLVLALTVFSETRSSDLSNGIGLVSVYAFYKKL